MAGRPKRMAQIVSGLEGDSHELAFLTYGLCPVSYLEKPDPDDPLAVAWNDAVFATMLASNKLEALGARLRDRAGIAGPTPFQEFEAELRAGQGRDSEPCTA